jgi:hypothetical protein
MMMKKRNTAPSERNDASDLLACLGLVTLS